MKQMESTEQLDIMPGVHLHDEHHDTRAAVEPAKNPDDASGNDPNSDPGGNWIAITNASLAIGDVIQWVIQPDCGAVATFLGVTRKESSGTPGQEGIIALDYEAYEQPALDRMRQIASYARERWPDLVRIAIIHRIGRVGLCEPSLLIVASSPHRSDALFTVSYIVDAVKSSVPIWKKEMFGTVGSGDANPKADGQGSNDLGMKDQASIGGDEEADGGQSGLVSSWATAHPLEDIPRPEEDSAPVQGVTPQATPPQPCPPAREGSPPPERPGSWEVRS